MLVGIAGAAGAGKDTAAQILHDKLGYTVDWFAWPIKAMLNAGFGWTFVQWQDRAWKEAIQPELGFSPREAAQKLGTEWRDAMGDNLLWAKMLKARRLKLHDIVIADVRFPHEQKWIHDNNGIVIFIDRPGTTPIEANNHASENSFNFRQCDGFILNSGTVEDLAERILHKVELFSNIEA